MFRFIAIRSVSALPTLLCILLIMFLLVKLMPGDPVLQDREDQSLGAAESRLTYDERAGIKGLDQPLFYFSVVPSTFPDSFYELPYSHQKITWRLYLSGWNWESALKFIHDIEAIDDQSEQMLDGDGLLSILLNRSDFSPETLFSQLKNKLNTTQSEEKRGQIQRLIDELGTEILNDRSFSDFIPSIIWHGRRNQIDEWFTSVFTFNFGTSKIDGLPISRKVLESLKWTLTINIPVVLLAYMLAIPFGLYSGWKEGRFDAILSQIMYIIYAMPIFWLATVLVVFFTTSEYGRWTNIFPAAGIWNSLPGESYADLLTRNIGQFFIPVLVISSHLWAYLTRLLRSAVIDEKSRTYVWMAKSKGLPERLILWKHILRNASFPLVTAFGSVFPMCVAGSLVVEVICNIPGMGRLLYDSIFSSDWNVVLFIVLLSSLLTILGLLVSDILYRLINPPALFPWPWSY